MVIDAIGESAVAVLIPVLLLGWVLALLAWVVARKPSTRRAGVVAGAAGLLYLGTVAAVILALPWRVTTILLAIYLAAAYCFVRLYLAREEKSQREVR